MPFSHLFMAQNHRVAALSPIRWGVAAVLVFVVWSCRHSPVTQPDPNPGNPTESTPADPLVCTIEGQVPIEAHRVCCWPQQQWSAEASRCVGEPQCPDQRLPHEEDCVVVAQDLESLRTACRQNGILAACEPMLMALEASCTEQGQAEHCQELVEVLLAEGDASAQELLQYHGLACEGGLVEHCYEGGALAARIDPDEAERLWFLGCDALHVPSCGALSQTLVERCRQEQDCQWERLEGLLNNLDKEDTAMSQSLHMEMCAAWVWAEQPMGAAQNPCRALTLRADAMAQQEEPPAQDIEALLEVACAGVIRPPTGYPETADPEACLALGIRLETEGKPKDLRRAVTLFRKACAVELPGACLQLGRFYENGLVVSPNPRRAATFYRSACDSGLWPGCTRLAAMMITGSGVRRDPEAAADLFERACDAGNPRACYELGLLLIAADGVDADPDRGRDLIKRACQDGYERACKAR